MGVILGIRWVHSHTPFSDYHKTKTKKNYYMVIFNVTVLLALQSENIIEIPTAAKHLIFDHFKAFVGFANIVIP